MAAMTQGPFERTVGYLLNSTHISKNVNLRDLARFCIPLKDYSCRPCRQQEKESVERASKQKRRFTVKLVPDC